MITTAEAIQDPIAFLKADPSIMIGHELTGLVVSGPDLDVLIQPTRERLYYRPVEREVCAFLGNLYMRSEAYADLPNDKRCRLDWYPSSQALNTLSEQLGRTPGKDAFRFETVDYDTIPDGPYIGYLATGIAPQSGQKDEFAHDRESHAPGNFLLPPDVVQNVTKLSANGDHGLVGKFDDMSAVYNDLLYYYVTKGTIEPRALREGRFTSNPNEIASLRTFWTNQDSPQGTPAFLANVGERIISHLEEIRPRVELLQGVCWLQQEQKQQCA